LTAIPYLNKVDVNVLLCRDYYAAWGAEAIEPIVNAPRPAGFSRRSVVLSKFWSIISNRSASRPGSWRRPKLRINIPLVRCICRNITRLKIGICAAWCLDARQWFSAISHHLALGGIRVPSCSKIDRNPLTAGVHMGVQYIHTVNPKYWR
jgi:hypothetical protein